MSIYLVSALLAWGTHVIANPVQGISNGTCYYAAGQVADQTYIPCGNSEYGNFTCCENQSLCLGHNACYSYDGTTYLASCTDPTYSDSVCPDKGPYGDQEWVGLVYCNGTSDEWTLCDETSVNSGTVMGTGQAAACACPSNSASRIEAFAAPQSLQNMASLPVKAGSTISYFDGFGPTGSSTSPRTTTTKSTSSTLSSSSSSAAAASTSNGTSSTPTPTSTPASSTSSVSLLVGSSGILMGTALPFPSSPSLSSGAKAGIGVGAAAGGLIALALLWLLGAFVRHRKRGKGLPEDSQIRPRSQAITLDKDPSDELGPHSPAWSGNKSELPSEERNSLVSPVSSQHAWTRPTSAEVEGTIPRYQSMGNLQAQEMGEGKPVYKPYRKAEIPPVGVQGVPGASASTQTAYRPGRPAGSGMFEMPAQIPGSTLPG